MYGEAESFEDGASEGMVTIRHSVHGGLHGAGGDELTMAVTAEFQRHW